MKILVSLLIKLIRIISFLSHITIYIYFSVVPIEILLTFNRIKALTTSLKDISTALENSDLLKLSEDKLKVCRTTEIKQHDDIDDFTIYVECLPSTADHDWIMNTFSIFGPIAYVSLPRYKKSNKIKEFGFIEFEQKSSVQRAISAFQEFRGVITNENTPEKLFSIVTFNQEQEQHDYSNEDNKKIIVKNAPKEDEDDGNQPQEKRVKLEEESKVEDEQRTEETKISDDATENEKTEDEIGKNDNDEDNNDDGDQSRKKKRKRMRKKKMDVKKVTTTCDTQITDLRITTK